MFFDDVQQGPPDVMYHLKVQADGDTSPNKVDLGVGIYRNEEGYCHELKALRDVFASDSLDLRSALSLIVGRLKPTLQLQTLITMYAPDSPNCASPLTLLQYEVTTGNSKYLQHAAAVVFGKNSQLLASGQVASAQTISGTGSIHIALMFLSHSVSGKKRTVYVGTPAWGNYEPMTKLAGLDFQSYKHYSPETGGVDWESIIEAVSSAPHGSIFVLQACCHNPTAADFSKEQWRDLATIMKRRQLIPLFDIAYQGLGNGLEEDIYCVRHFAQEGFEMLVCQSFSKNFGLYGERVGALHVVTQTPKAAMSVHDQVRFLIRSEFSSSPAFGARLVTHILSDPDREASWIGELNSLHKRLHTLRAKLFDLLSNVYKCQELKAAYHIYMVPNGRITIPGLNAKNIDYVAKSIDSVVRGTESHARSQPGASR
ncbi:unnamed protein product [Clonostachys rosea]|uniref:Aspartate aminotransferase n=1 Tax=Bionectria ochroleuca TaxID=29856 RepID=A0ABY6V044_BIOOC|nr:unnamed protein product [Clonostachys rosea]